jgi:hypothetical protein
MEAVKGKGRLVFSRRAKLGISQIFDYYCCVDCGTEYPKKDNEPITCNGDIIGQCPWCRPDSKPWANGRGK